MKILSHFSAKPSHYNKEAKYYDEFNQKASYLINHQVEKILKEYDVSSVLDFACGTGAQVFWLLEAGFDITGVDINASMLRMAQRKAKAKNVNVRFLKGDMRTLWLGSFEAVITIFNAIGHLTKTDFEKALQNIRSNLAKGGIYVFDIFNAGYLKKGHNILKLTLDRLAILEDTHIREIQFSYVDNQGVLSSYTTSFQQKIGEKPDKISTSYNTLQCYTCQELQMILKRNGFSVIRQLSADGEAFSHAKTERILMAAQM